MWHLFQKLFKKNSPAPARRQARPRLESLESRNLLNAGPILSATSFLGGAAHVGSCSGGTGSSPSSSSTVLTATLTGATGTAGTATFTSSTTAGTNSLGLKVSGLAASTSFSVMAGTTMVGTITTDAKGNGSLKLSSLAATIAAGTALTLVDPGSATVLTGTFATATPCQPGSGLSAPLTGATGTSGNLHFLTSATAGQNAIDVQVKGLAASSTFTVNVGTTTVGSIATDANGKGQLKLTGLSTTAAAGTAVTILDSTGATVLSGTLALDAHHH
jgi:phage protein U